MTHLTENAQKFLSHNPVLISVVAGYKFYEHPQYGDESPLVVITPDGKKKTSPFWEAPSLQDVCEEYNLTLTRG